MCLCKELIEPFSALCENVGIHADPVILFGVGITVTVNPDACKVLTDMIRQFRIIFLGIRAVSVGFGVFDRASRPFFRKLDVRCGEHPIDVAGVWISRDEHI